LTSGGFRIVSDTLVLLLVYGLEVMLQIFRLNDPSSILDRVVVRVHCEL